MYLNPNLSDFMMLHCNLVNTGNAFGTRLVVAGLIIDSLDHTARPLWGPGYKLGSCASEGLWKSGTKNLPGQRSPHTWCANKRVDVVSKLQPQASNIFSFPNGRIKCAHSCHSQRPQRCWVLVKGRVESKPKIPEVQLPVPDHTTPANEAAFGTAVSAREPAVQL